MKATVVISTYNQEKYIEECLKSILMQVVNFDFDILISDDCSTDLTKNIIRLYQSKYPHLIKVIDRVENVGAAINYLQAHQRVTGDIVFHIDGDDIMLPGKMQKQYNEFLFNDKVNIVFHRAYYFSDDESYFSATGSPVAVVNGKIEFSARDLALWGSITVHSAYCYRRSSRTNWPESEFMEWYLAMDSLLPEGLGIYLDDILVKYRCNAFAGAYLSTKKGRIKAYQIYFDNLFTYFYNYPQLQKELYSNCLITLFAMCKGRYRLYTRAYLFIIKRCYLFRLSNFIKTTSMRTSVAPGIKIR